MVSDKTGMDATMTPIVPKIAKAMDAMPLARGFLLMR